MRVPSLWLAPLVVLTFSGAILIGQTWELPTMGQEFAAATSEEQTIEMIVQGLRCRGTSNFFLRKMADIPGLLSASTFVQEHRAEIKYDPSLIDVGGIRRAIESPVVLADGRLVQPFQVVEIKE